MKNLLTSLLFFTMMLSFSQEVQKRQIIPSQIDAVFSQWDSTNKPGIAVGILNDDKIVYTKGFGLANLEHQIPISPETKFHIGDIAKEFTVYALLLLEERGKLTLEDRIQKYIPKFNSMPYTINIKQLIHHTSGLNNLEVSKTLAGWQPNDVFNKKQAYKMILNLANSQPKSGSVQYPTDAGFMILEDIITKVSKMPYTDFITKEIFEPLKMTNSIFDNQGAVITNKAQGYFSQNNEFVSSTMHSSQTIVSQLYTTVIDMCRWAKELKNPKIGSKKVVEKFDGLSVVNNKPVEEINRALYTGGHRFWNFRGAKKLTHIEVAGGYASKLIRYPEYDLAIVVMGNDGAYNGYAGTGASALYIEDFLASPTEAASVTINSKKISKKQLTEFEGNYWDVKNHSSRKIHITNDTLRYFRGAGNESPLVPLGKNSFKMISGGEVTVNFNTNSVPKTMTVIVGDERFNFAAYNTNSNWAKDLSPYTGTYNSSDLNTSYSLSIENKQLVLMHLRMETVRLEPRITDLFTGNQRHFSSLTFKKDENGYIKGFILSTEGISNIWFEKETISNQDIVKTK